MTEYAIYQINRDRDVNRIMFWDYDTAVKVNAGEFDTSIYDEVYWDIRDFKSLDEMFEVFNCDRPADFHGHSMSMSDVVKIIKSDTMETGSFYCDSFGWKKVDM